MLLFIKPRQYYSGFKTLAFLYSTGYLSLLALLQLRVSSQLLRSLTDGLEEWDRITIDEINNLIDSIASRIRALVAAEGRHTKNY
jgi:hypothetical protein